MSLRGLKIALVGPLPPPAGGMAGQTLQLAELMAREGVDVTLVPVNASYRPHWISRLRGVRALFRFVPYVFQLWRVAGRTDLLHIMANSGWSWHLIAAPAVWIAKLRATPSIVNYRGGEAKSFLTRSGRIAAATLNRASAIVVPSAYLAQIFENFGLRSEIVPNIIDVGRFYPAVEPRSSETLRLVVARNLEPIYGIATALRAFALVGKTRSEATLVVAGSGPELGTLTSLAAKLGIAARVNFCGQLDRDQMAELYRSASIVLNPSTVDNMPNSVLEAMASGVPVVSTDVGGVPFILHHGLTGLLVAKGDHEAMATAAQKILSDPKLAARLRNAALAEVQQYRWAHIRTRWAAVYSAALVRSHVEARRT